MTTRTATARLDDDGRRFVATTGSGHSVLMDDALGDSGARPAELLLVAQAGCEAMDVVTMLRAQAEPFTSYEVRVIGDQRHNPPPHVIDHIRVLHVIEGDVSIDAVRRAIELSATRYSTVTANLASGVAQVRHAYQVRDTAGKEHAGEVVVTGPHMRPGERTPRGRGSAAQARARAVISIMPRASRSAQVSVDMGDHDRALVRRRPDSLQELLLELI
jgi:putative redox protein